MTSLSHLFPQPVSIYHPSAGVKNSTCMCLQTMYTLRYYYHRHYWLLNMFSEIFHMPRCFYSWRDLAANLNPWREKKKFFFAWANALKCVWPHVTHGGGDASFLYYTYTTWCQKNAKRGRLLVNKISRESESKITSTNDVTDRIMNTIIIRPRMDQAHLYSNSENTCCRIFFSFPHEHMRSNSLVPLSDAKWLKPAGVW